MTRSARRFFIQFVLFFFFSPLHFTFSQSASVNAQAVPPFQRLLILDVPAPTPAVPETIKVIKSKSPGKAVLLSTLAPGLGQIYTESYWKVPIIWGLGGYYIYEWVRNNNQYRDFRDQYLRSITTTVPQGDLRLKTFRDFYHNQRDSFTWYFGILYLANLVDAYVSASLYEFDVSDDLSLEFGKSSQFMTLRWRW